MAILTITAGLTGWYGHVSGEPTDTDEELLDAARRLHGLLLQLTDTAPRRARAPLDASGDSADPTQPPKRKTRQKADSDALTADGRATLDFLIANPDVKPMQAIDAVPGGVKTLRWLVKKGWIDLDVPTQRYTILRTE